MILQPLRCITAVQQRFSSRNAHVIFSASRHESMRFQPSILCFKQLHLHAPSMPVHLRTCMQIFITDSVLAAIMCTPRAVYSWDVVITRRGNQLWFDKRPNNVLDQESVNETAPEGVQEDDSINGVASLAREATAIRQTFSQQCLDRSQTHDLGAPDPLAPVRLRSLPAQELHASGLATACSSPVSRAALFGCNSSGTVSRCAQRFDGACTATAHQLVSAPAPHQCVKWPLTTLQQLQNNGQPAGTSAYHYRIWDLGDDVHLAARCEIDAVMHRQGRDYLLTTRTFNQANVGASDVDWKRKLEHQSAAVLAMEVKNNSNRVARWTLSTILAGADLMKARRTHVPALWSVKASGYC